MEPPRKRQSTRRVTLACLACRARKTRCDGHQPVCIACERRGAAGTCRYELNPNKRPPDQQQDELAPYRGIGISRPDQDLEAEVVVGPAGHAARTSMDGLATVPSFSESDALYGPSSSVALSRSVDPKVTSHLTNDSSVISSSQRYPASRQHHPVYHDGPVAMLPRRRNADDFLGCFWNFIHPVFPILYKPAFVQQYYELWSSTESFSADDAASNDGDDIVFMTTLNLVFALGSKFSNNVAPARREEVADSFYDSAWRGYALNLLDSESVSVVQMLLLNGVYLQSTYYPSRCWNTVGLAIRVAQSLGLHNEHRTTQGRSQLQLEVGRRIWHNCMSLDRLLSMTFGRPTVITSLVAVPVPTTIDDEYLSSTDTGSQPPGLLSYLSLFTYSCSLFDILKDALQLFTLRGPSDSSLAQPRADALPLDGLMFETLNLSRRLDRFRDSVPAEIRILDDFPVSTEHQHSTLNLMQQVLYCRYLYVRLLSMRPLLMHGVKTERSTRGFPFPEDSFDFEIMQRICQQCVETAHRLVKTILKHLATPYRSAGWHAVYFTFSAAVIVLTASQSSMTDVSIDNDTFHAFWSQCESILRDHELQISVAGRALEVLEAIKRGLLSNRSQAREAMQATGLDDVNLDGEPTEAMSTPGKQRQEALDIPYIFDTDSIDATWLNQWLADTDWLENNATQDTEP